MSNAKRWKQLSGGKFFKFEKEGDCLEGLWQGTQVGKFGDNGVIEVDGVPQLFTLNTALKDLMRVKPGTEVRVTFMGKEMSKGGNEYKAFQIFVEDGASIAPDEEVPF